MAADIVERPDGFIVVTNDDNWLAAGGCRSEITGVGDLAFMANKQPGFGENPPHFLGKYSLIGEDAVVQIVGFRQIGYVMA